jgi:uroporphyrinogen decarboxylase
VPVVYFANGGSGYLHAQNDMSFDALATDWRVSMETARRTVGPDRVLQGNVDPIVLYGSEEKIRAAVETCIRQAGGRHVLNLGHGVEKDIPEEAVAAFVNAAKNVKINV